MKALAEFAIRRRWWVIAGWIAVIVVAQGIAGAMGGAAYHDTFSLPHTETATVARLLKDAGLNNQNGVAGTVVVRNTDGAAFTGAPPELQPALAKVCASGNHVALISTPWQSIDCSKGAATPPGTRTAEHCTRVDHRSGQHHVGEQPLRPRAVHGVYDTVKSLRSSTLQVEFTGNAFAGIGQSNGSGGSVFIGFLAALIILALVFRTVAATVLPLASAVVALVGGLAVIYILSHAINVSNITPYLAELMVIGVGVDYALFIVTRHRRNLRRGMPLSGLDRHGDQHLRTRGAVRRDHGLHRHPRPHRARRELLQRHGGGHRARGRLHHGRVADAAAGAAEPVRAEGAAAQATRGRARRRLHQPAGPWVLGSLVTIRRRPSRRRRRRLRCADDRRWPSRSSRCSWAAATRAATRRGRRPGSATT